MYIYIKMIGGVTKECIDRANYLLGERMNVRFNDENKGEGVYETHYTRNQSYTRARWLIHP
jgi:hypothetical protein